MLDLVGRIRVAYVQELPLRAQGERTLTQTLTLTLARTLALPLALTITRTLNPSPTPSPTPTPHAGGGPLVDDQHDRARL